MRESAEKNAGFRRITILGLGAMGASLGMALKRLATPPRVTGYSRSPQTRAAAAEIAAADTICDDPIAAVAGAELVVGCLPVQALVPVFRELLPKLTGNIVLTDVGSTKQWLDHEIRKLLQATGHAYVGSHPMTGTEKSGPAAARADLYRNATVFLTPTGAGSPKKTVVRLRKFWQSVGARVYFATPAEHDRLVARTSHLPHLAAAALVNVALRDRPEGIQPFIGPGFRDTTRVAGGSPEMWRDIVCTNREALLKELDEFRKKIEHLHRDIESENFESVRLFLEEARCRRSGKVASSCEQ